VIWGYEQFAMLASVAERLSYLSTNLYGFISWYICKFEMPGLVKRKVVKVGNSWAVILPRGYVRYHGLEGGEIVLVYDKILVIVPETDIEKVKTTEQYKDYIEYSEVYKTLQDRNYKLVIIDSLTMPLKDEIPKEVQNFPARGSLEDALLKTGRLLASLYDVAFIITDHAVRDPMRGTINPWGGDDMLYNVKHWIGILTCDKELRKKYGDDIRKIFRRRSPGMLEETKIVRLEKDTGYIDLSDTKRVEL